MSLLKSNMYSFILVAASRYLFIGSAFFLLKFPWWCQRSDKKGYTASSWQEATVTQITTCCPRYAEDHFWMHNTSYLEAMTVEQISYRRRRLHWVPLSQEQKTEATVRKEPPKCDNSRLIKCFPVWWVSISAAPFRRYSKVRIWCKQHKSMDSSCLVIIAQAAAGVGETEWGIFSWHTLGLLVPTELCLNVTAYPSIVDGHVHLFTTTMYRVLMAASGMITIVMFLTKCPMTVWEK